LNAKKEGGGGTGDEAIERSDCASEWETNQAHNINEHKNQNQAIFSAGAGKKPRKWQNELPELTSWQNVLRLATLELDPS
jgi:hypothetical protein